MLMSLTNVENVVCDTLDIGQLMGSYMRSLVADNMLRRML